MERLVMLWDELDELACWGRQLAIGLLAALPRPRRRRAATLATNPVLP